MFINPIYNRPIADYLTQDIAAFPSDIGDTFVNPASSMQGTNKLFTRSEASPSFKIVLQEDKRDKALSPDEKNKVEEGIKFDNKHKGTPGGDWVEDYRKRQVEGLNPDRNNDNRSFDALSPSASLDKMSSIKKIPVLGALPTLFNEPAAYAHPITALENKNANPLLVYSIGAITAGAAAYTKTRSVFAGGAILATSALLKFAVS